MTTLNFNLPLLNVDGSIIENGSLSKTLSELIGTLQTGNTVKLYGWHQTLLEKKSLILDDADKAYLQKIIEDDVKYYVFVKGQLLKVIFDTKAN